MGDIAGSDVGDDNFRLRFFVIIFMGLLSVGSVIYWRNQTYMAAEYKEMPPTAQESQVKQENRTKQKKQNQVQSRLLQNVEE